MKMIVALIRPHQLPFVKVALHENGINHFTATSAMGTAPAAKQQTFRGVERRSELHQRLRLEIAVSDEQVELVIESIIDGSKNCGRHGVIFVQDVVDVIRVWNGARGDAIQRADQVQPIMSDRAKGE
ncbi:MAG: nitrogen regulatory protein PII [Kiritimatiellia bacterium]|jgi:nitrogen regulatory protein PII